MVKKAHLSLSEWNGHLIADLESGVQLVATTTEKMVEQLIQAGITEENLSVTNWKVDIDHAPSNGVIIAIKLALRQASNPKVKTK